MVVGKVKKPTPEVTLNTCIGGLMQGETQKVIRSKLGISRPTIGNHLKKMGTTWEELVSKYTCKKEDVKVSKDPEPEIIYPDKNPTTNEEVTHPIVIYPDRKKQKPPPSGPSKKDPSYDEDRDYPINEEFLENGIRTAMAYAKQQEDPATMMKALALGFQLLKEKKELKQGTGQENEYRPEEMEDLMRKWAEEEEELE